ncbi:8411_t:CDS:2 [Diversispora eburnea]|uniref:Crossover junction endonuclease MUS81 n=1 Tax=Diversispora eburnea TaxID=1213867 RepID=A0A9N8VW66_9GLOM|nr:8411_t:CDS:2 [Diversispora eburnea]
MPPKKIKETATCGNPLFLKWLGEWMESERATNNKIYYTYKKAYESMSKYPLPFSHPSEAAILNGIGPGICQKLEIRLQKHCEEIGQPMPQRLDESIKSERNVRKRNQQESNDYNEEIMLNGAKRKNQKTSTPKIYIPKFRSGAYAILLALYKSSEVNSISSMIKTDLIKEAQQYCDYSFDMPNGKQHFYTAWNSMKTLLEKDLVYKSSSPIRFSLTEAGLTVARQMVLTASVQECSSSFKDIDDRNEHTIISASNIQMSTFDPIIWTPDIFEVILVLDTREVKLKKDRDYIQETLQQRGVKISVRNLELGDVIWVARKNGSFIHHEDIVLDYIVERKRMDDLIGSIKDGRFREQRFRLSKSGAGQIIYLIEDYNLEKAVEFGMDAVKTAMSSIQMLNGYFLKRTANIDQSIDYLVRMTKMLKNIYENKTLYAIPDNAIYRNTFLEMKQNLTLMYPDRNYHVTYSSYCDLNSKSRNLTLKDTFIKMIMTIKGISADKAAEIIKKYPTPLKLVQEFNSISNEDDKKKMIMAACESAIRRKRIGPTLSEKMYQIWCADNY